MKSFMESDLVVEQIRLCCFVAAGAGAPIHRNRAAHGLVFCTRGAEIYRFEGGEALEVREGDVLYLPRGCSYAVEEVSAAECYAINFDISKQESAKPFVLHPKARGELQNAFSKAERLWRGKQPGYRMRCMELLYHLLCRLQEEYRAAYVPQSKRALIAPAIARIHGGEESEPLSVAALAEVCGITPEYFRAIFRQCYGESPRRYINALRLSHARELIESGMYSVSEAAVRCGFVDQSHFSREFKRHFGVPPSTCRGK